MQVCDEKGVQIVMAAMQRHSDSAKVVASTCGLLRQLAKSDGIKKLFVSLDGFDLMTATLEAHKQSAPVCTQVRPRALGGARAVRS